ncbi:MAG TPA: glucose 1-dehydrogenase [Stellaceae bacterium]|nr:glucose 1-dehydrogenase [Stellaceae bacterium]
MTNRLDGKVAFITGGASGLGRAMAEAFAAEGARVAIADIDRTRGQDVVRSIGAAALFLAHDVTSEEQWIANLGAAASAFGHLDTLVNNAGVGSRGDVENTTLEEWRRIHAVNLDGPFLGCKHGIPLIAKAGGGAIVNVSSVAGLIGARDSAAYCASKGGLRLLTKSVALHCAHRKNGVRCNSIHPVYTDTPMVGQMLAESRQPDKMLEALKAMIPLGRLGTPAELAAMAVYLVSDEARFVTGAEFVFDGGYTAN